MKKTMKYSLLALALVFGLGSCGVEGDPGYVFFALDWEDYEEDYRVTYYEDDNINVPIWEDIIADLYYECYPGRYEYYYESEDHNFFYDTEGYYELTQISGSNGGIFYEGLDGADSYFELFLYVDPKLMNRRKGVSELGIITETISTTMVEGSWELKTVATIRATPKTQSQN